MREFWFWTRTYSSYYLFIYIYLYIYGFREHLAIYKLPETIQTLVIVSHTHLFLYSLEDLYQIFRMTRNIAGNRMNHFQSKWRQIIPFKELLSNCRPPFKKVRMSIYCKWPNFTEEICIHCDFCCINLIYIDSQLKLFWLHIFKKLC